MFRFGSVSSTRKATCHDDLQLILERAMATQLMDFSVITGHRGQHEQDAARAKGASKLSWPNSKHNRYPSSAVDIAPYPIDWGEEGDARRRQKAIGRFYKLAGIVLATAVTLGIPLRWGGNWDGDNDLFDQDFDDLVHFELR